MLKEDSVGTPCWWCKILAVGIISFLLFCWGTAALINAYYLKNPQEFVMIFFSSSFLILLGITGMIYPVCRLHEYFQNDRHPDRSR